MDETDRHGNTIEFSGHEHELAKGRLSKSKHYHLSKYVGSKSKVFLYGVNWNLHYQSEPSHSKISKN